MQNSSQQTASDDHKDKMKVGCGERTVVTKCAGSQESHPTAVPWRGTGRTGKKTHGAQGERFTSTVPSE